MKRRVAVLSVILAMALILLHATEASAQAAPGPSATASSPAPPMQGGLTVDEKWQIRRANKVMLAGGLVFAGAYTLSAGIAFTLKASGGGQELLIPVAGPIVSIVKIQQDVAHCYQDSKDRQDHSLCGLFQLVALFGDALLGVDALAQGGGLVALVMGATDRPSAHPRATAAAAKRTKPRVMPYATGTTFGLTGTF